ncbi:MAG: hypothetical protein GX070_06405 [Alcaligenaceae bacterium]|nr:hypothetical protein [Alcaligenaceae bacterium]
MSLVKLKNKIRQILFALGSAPMTVGVVLVLPLWFLLDNFLIAAILAVFVAFLLAMSVSLYRLNTESGDGNDNDASQGNTKETGKEKR